MALENNQIDNSNTDNDEISLKELLFNLKVWGKYFILNWKFIILFALAGGLVGFVIASKDEYKYNASLTFVLEEDRGGGSGGGLGGAMGLASSLGIDIGNGGGGVFSGTNLPEFMKSRFIIEKTLLNPVFINKDTISIAEYYINLNKLRESWKETKFQNIKFPYNTDRADFKIEQDSILNIFYGELSNKKVLSIGQIDKKSSITEIKVTNKNENFAKVFCENLAVETSKYYIELKSKKARLNYEILQQQVDSIRSKLNNAINGVASNNDNVYNLNPAFNIKRTPSNKKQFDVQSNSQILTQLLAQLELSKLALRKETPLIQIIDKPILPLDKKILDKSFAIKIGIVIGLVLFFIIFYFKKAIS